MMRIERQLGRIDLVSLKTNHEQLFRFNFKGKSLNIGDIMTVFMSENMYYGEQE